MDRKTRQESEAGLEVLRKRLERWRSAQKGRRTRIPEELWKQAAQAAAKYGVNRVSARLRLDYYSLRSQLEKLSGGAKADERLPTFVELAPPPAQKSSANAIEFQKAGGSKVRIEFQGQMTRELSRLSEKLWRAAR